MSSKQSAITYALSDLRYANSNMLMLTSVSVVVGVKGVEYWFPGPVEHSLMVLFLFWWWWL